MIDFMQMSNEFLASKLASNRADGTLIWYRCMFDQYIEWTNASGYSDSDLAHHDTLVEYLTASRGQGLKEDTVLGRYRALRALFRWCERRGHLEDGNPFDLIEAPTTTSKLPKAISWREMERLCASIRGDSWHAQRDRLIIQFLFFTGVRVSELCRLTLADVDLERRSLRVQRYKTHSQGFVPIAKSLATELAHWIENVRPDADTPALFVGEGQNKPLAPLAKVGVTEMLRRRCKAAGMKIYRPHAFRHGCAVAIIQRGGDVSLVQRVLGHSDSRTSLIYLRFDVEHIKELYDRVFG